MRHQVLSIAPRIDLVSVRVKDTKPNFSEYLSHSAYLTIMDVRSELILILPPILLSVEFVMLFYDLGAYHNREHESYDP